MKRKRFSVEQIAAVLKQAEVGVSVAELIRKAGVSEQTFYRWKKQYAGLEGDQVRSHRDPRTELRMQGPGDRPGSSALRISKDPGAAEPGGLEGGPISGGPDLPGRRTDAAPAAETPSSGSGASP